jgi:hypothetical protein
MVVLRTLGSSSFSCPQISDATDLTISMIRGRQHNATLWRPHELGQLAEMLRLPNRFADHLKTISQHLDELAPSQFQQVRSFIKLTPAQIASRKKDYRLWQFAELERLLNGLSKLVEADSSKQEAIIATASKRGRKSKMPVDSILRMVSR